MKRELQVLAKGKFFEGPRWRDGRWWVSDFYRHAVYAVTPEGNCESVLNVEQQPSGIGWMPDGSMLVVSMKDHRVLRCSVNGEVSVHADLSPYCGGPANDMVVDRHGRAFVGNFGFDLLSGGPATTAALLRVDPDGSVHVAAERLFFPNGSVITPDGCTLIVGETIGNRYSAFTIRADGELTDRRVWAQFGPEPNLGNLSEAFQQMVVAPDGCVLDAEEQIWAADPIHNRCVRIAEGGKITDEIAAPEGLSIFACMLGGQDGRTLLLCAATNYLPTAEGVLLITQVDAPHAGLP
jgi:sugar lactone lactonase YvrE